VEDLRIITNFIIINDVAWKPQKGKKSQTYLLQEDSLKSIRSSLNPQGDAF